MHIAVLDIHVDDHTDGVDVGRLLATRHAGPTLGCRIWHATAIQPSGDLTQEWVSVRSARGLWRGR